MRNLHDMLYIDAHSLFTDSDKPRPATQINDVSMLGTRFNSVVRQKKVR